ncbi:LLM class flavin-dependent oxidoreductase, partial [Streptomyces harbinensis]|uniref:LLM class flavin-dependent oxidoreductase n=1 Tax=Streptomyces harbinensis TaxID=1176198 RepID=UPI003F697FC5
MLLLPGGRADGHSRPARFGPTVLRMLPFRSAIRSATAGHAVVTGIVRYRHRGWNGGHEDPLRDTEAALDRLAGRLGPSYRGDFYSAHEVRTIPGCVQRPRLPFAVAATGPRGMRLAARLGPVPVVLVGHSMGGRAALRAAGHPAVTGVVALAPW